MTHSPTGVLFLPLLNRYVGWADAGVQIWTSAPTLNTLAADPSTTEVATLAEVDAGRLVPTSVIDACRRDIEQAVRLAEDRDETKVPEEDLKAVYDQHLRPLWGRPFEEVADTAMLGRVSTDHLANNTDSTMRQVTKPIAAIIRAGKFPRAAAWEAESGMTMDREGLASLLETAAKTKLKYLVVSNLDRLGRHPPAALPAVAALQFLYDVRVVYQQPRVSAWHIADMENPVSIGHLSEAFTSALKEWIAIRTRTQDGKAGALRDRVWPQDTVGCRIAHQDDRTYQGKGSRPVRRAHWEVDTQSRVALHEAFQDIDTERRMSWLYGVRYRHYLTWASTNWDNGNFVQESQVGMENKWPELAVMSDFWAAKFKIIMERRATTKADSPLAIVPGGVLEYLTRTDPVGVSRRLLRGRAVVGCLECGPCRCGNYPKFDTVNPDAVADGEAEDLRCEGGHRLSPTGEVSAHAYGKEAKPSCPNGCGLGQVLAVGMLSRPRFHLFLCRACNDFFAKTMPYDGGQRVLRQRRYQTVDQSWRALHKFSFPTGDIDFDASFPHDLRPPPGPATKLVTGGPDQAKLEASA